MKLQLPLTSFTVTLTLSYNSVRNSEYVQEVLKEYSSIAAREPQVRLELNLSKQPGTEEEFFQLEVSYTEDGVIIYSNPQIVCGDSAKADINTIDEMLKELHVY